MKAQKSFAKRCIAFILVFIMAGSFFVIGASAEYDFANIETYFAEISHVKQTSPGGKDYSSMWDYSRLGVIPTAGTSYSENAYGVVIVGQFDKPTVIGEIVVRTSFYQQRTDGIDVYASVDSADGPWVLLWEIRMPSQSGPSVLISKEVDDSTEYNFLKMEKPKNSGSQGASSWFELVSLAIVPADKLEKADNQVDATFIPEMSSAAESAINSPANIWEHGNYHNWSGISTENEKSVAMLEKPTYLTKVEYNVGYLGYRVRGSSILASVDGVNWDEIGFFGDKDIESQDKGLGTTDEAYLNNNNLQFQTFVFELDGTKAYNYIKVEQRTDWGANVFFAGMSIKVYGECENLSFKGVQAKDGELTYDLRLVSVIDSYEFKNAGYTIKATYNSVVREYNLVTDRVCNEIVATDSVIITADELGGNYIYAIVITDIKKEYGDITFEITPWLETFEGEYIIGITKTFSTSELPDLN